MFFLRNLLLNESHPLQNRTLHISGTFKEIEKPDIEKQFSPKTESHNLKLREAFPGEAIFGRSDVMKIVDIKPSRASELLKKLTEYRVIEPVSGHGKGKYRFRKQQGWRGVKFHPFSLRTIFNFGLQLVKPLWKRKRKKDGSKSYWPHIKGLKRCFLWNAWIFFRKYQIYVEIYSALVWLWNSATGRCTNSLPNRSNAFKQIGFRKNCRRYAILNNRMRRERHFPCL